MGCVSSKQALSVTPVADQIKAKSGRVRGGLDDFEKKYRTEFAYSGSELGESGRASSNGDSLSFRLGNLHKYVEAEQVAAGWPAWLSAVAGEAIQGWVPLRSDAFEKLDKIGQGTYSSVFRAKEFSTGRIVALKKVRFDNFDPESVRFMAREIMILRKLDHPNIMKLDGIITSRLSCSIYLVFEYMEHDITGLLSCPDITFSEAQVKCYMQQLLSGLEHCHSQGIMHRDIKGSNLLVNNEGVLKVADFGLANFCRSGYRQPLTSRVVTLWYRPPELLLGSTDYGAHVDLWSVGCVFAELLLGKPILQGKTEVEQLHRIFKLCGSPADEYWNNKKFPHATLFKPHQRYDSCLQETFKALPTTSVNLIETLLSVEPYKRGTASSALASEYFKVKPCACDPSTLPRYPPSKEIDAKYREEAIRRKKTGGRVRGPEIRKPVRKAYGTNKLASDENMSVHQTQGAHKGNRDVHILKEVDATLCGEALKASIDKPQETSHVKNASHGDIPFSGPLQVSTSSGFAWARRRKDDPSSRSHTRSLSKGYSNNALETSAVPDEKHKHDSKVHDSEDDMYKSCTNSRGYGSYDGGNCRMMQKKYERQDSFYTSDGYHSQELSLALYQEEEMANKRRGPSYQVEGDKVEFSGPLLSQPHRVDELLERHERQIRQAVRKSWFQRGNKHMR